MNGTTKLPKEQETLQRAVDSYLTLLSISYERLNMNHLNKAATSKRIAKAYHHMASLAEAKVKMLTTLKQINYSDAIIASPSQATLKTEEFWEYQYIDVDTGKEKFSNTVTYKINYTLTREDETWLVDDIEVISHHEEKKAMQLVPFFERPPDEPIGAKRKIDGLNTTPNSQTTTSRTR